MYIQGNHIWANPEVNDLNSIFFADSNKAQLLAV